MKKIGIITIIDNENCGNRLQNYALQEYLKRMGFEVTTLKNDKLLNSKEKFNINCLKYIKKKVTNYYKVNSETKRNFKRFNKNIKFSKYMITAKSKNIEKKFDYFIVGSDQVWKPTRKRMSYIDLLGFAPNNKRVAYAASFGIDEIEEKYKKKLNMELPKFKAISVREDAGKRIVFDATGINDVSVVLDPTMLIERKEWNKLETCPFDTEKENYVLSYFLGDESKESIKEMCRKNNLSYVDFYDKSNHYGPMEFLYLINHASVIVTDSFHGCVFSILFGKNFYVLDRKQKDTNNNMNSRLETLLNVFNLKERKINSITESIITEDNKLDLDMIESKLSIKRKEADAFLKNALE